MYEIEYAPPPWGYVALFTKSDSGDLIIDLPFSILRKSGLSFVLSVFVGNPYKKKMNLFFIVLASENYRYKEILNKQSTIRDILPPSTAATLQYNSMFSFQLTEIQNSLSVKTQPVIFQPMTITHKSPLCLRTMATGMHTYAKCPLCSSVPRLVIGYAWQQTLVLSW